MTKQTSSNPSIAILVMPCPSEEEGGIIHVLDEAESSISSPDRHAQKKSSPMRIIPHSSIKIESSFGAFGSAIQTTNDIRNDEDEDSIMGDEELVTVSHPQQPIEKGSIGVISIVPPLHVESQDAPGGFDVCREYGYKYEYTEEHDKDEEAGEERCETHLQSNSGKHATNQDPMYPNYKYFILGKGYHPILDYAFRRIDETSLLWFTYRCDFPEIKPYGITSDAGWGCMLRSAQMLFAQALRIHYCGRKYIPPQSTVQKRADPFIQDLLMWFADFPSYDTGCWYSLQNMVATGLARYETLPGEWFGPQTASYILRDLAELHHKAWEQKFGEKLKVNSQNCTKLPLDEYRRSHPVMRVYLAHEGCIYRDDVNELMTKGSSQCREKKGTSPKLKKAEGKHDSTHPLEIINNLKIPQLEWDSSVLILIPLRLGLESFNASSYSNILAHSFCLPQSVGFVGGYPRHALWFYGALSDGSKLYGLDPHTIQSAPGRRRLKPEEEARTRNTKQYQVQLSDAYLRSIQCPNPRVIETSKIDPSLALGFYCRDRTDFELFCTTVIKEMNSPSLFTIAETKPDYSADVSSAMVEMMLGSASHLDKGDLYNEECDDDDFVML